MAEKFNVELKPVQSFGDFEIIETPGHTVGSICILYKPDEVLFSGDTFFKNKQLGRTDLPTSVPEEMQKTVMKLLELNHKILCPGHDY